MLGTGAAASSAAYTCNAADLDVAVVDSRPYGGTCALRGCDPKKVLTGAAGLVQSARRMHGHGVRCHGVDIDWPQLMAFKRTFTDPVPKDREEAFHEVGIETLHGRARFADRGLIDVDGQRIRADHVVVATGAKPRPLDMPGAELLATSEAFLDLDELPERIAFVGGGYVSLEFAHLAAHAGAEAHVLTRGERALAAFDPDLVAALLEAGRDVGIQVHTGSPVREVEATDDGYRVYSDGEQPALEHDLVVHGAGRVPEIEDLDLEQAGVEHDGDGIAVDEHLRSVSNDRIWAAGDAAATAGWPLTPIAGREGKLAARNLIAARGDADAGGSRGGGGDAEESRAGSGQLATMDYAGTTSVAFTIPPVARVGLTEREAHQAEADVEVHEGDTSEWFSQARLRSSPAGYKVILEAASGRVLGAHLLGPQAEETINLFALGVRQGLTADELEAVPWAYPSHGNEITYMV